MRNSFPKAGRVESVHRALALLKVISEEGSLNVTDAANLLDVHPSTAQRLLATLAGADYARQDVSRRYLPGPALFQLPHQAASARQLLHPFAQRLFAATGETIHVATLVGTEVHHPDAIESLHTIRFGLRLGVRIPAHITGEGKSLLAALPWREVEARYSLALSGEKASGWNLNLANLRHNLAVVRKQGYATNFEESEPGIAAYSMMVGVLGGEYCALSIAMPIARFTEELGESFVTNLRDIVQEARNELNLDDPYLQIRNREDQ